MDDFETNELDRFREIERIFQEVCDLEPDQRPVRLDALCGSDEPLRKSVQSMLNADDETHAMIDSDGPLIGNGELESEDDEDPIPERIGDFSILKVLGEGGMGIVYEAVQDSPKRHVALKVIRQRSLHSKIRKRFEREADILARLNHPSIATIYESGIAQDGDRSTPYVSMELVVGESITEYCMNKGLDTESKITLMRDVCRGVAYAHDLGIVHRDLKPSNILVDQEGRVRILDFGIAFDLEIEQRTQMTQTGQLLGTLQYMAPEQVDRRSHTTSKQTDVYALGLICYELLIGENPLDRHSSSMYEMVRAIRDVDHGMLGTMDRTFRGDVETIVAKAISREIDQRYLDAGVMADDLDRYLNHQPIIARRPSSWYQLRKFSERNPVLVGSIMVLMGVLVVALLLIGNALRIATQERGIAQQQKEAQELINAFVTDDLFAAGNPNFGGDADILLLDAMRESAEGISERFVGAPEAEASIRLTMGEQFRLMNDYENAMEHISKSVEITESLGLDAEILIDRLNSLSDVYMDIDELEQSLEIVERADALAAAHPEIPVALKLDTLIQHASLLYHMRNAEGAAPIFEQAVELGRTHAPESDGTMSAIGALAIVYTRIQRYDEAEALHREGVEMQIRIDGPEHPSTLTTQDNLGMFYLQTEDYELAESAFREVLEIRKRVFGDDHVKTYLTTATLGRSLTLQERFAESEEYLLPTYTRMVEVLGYEHRYTVVTRFYMHDLYRRWGKTDLADQYIEIARDSTESG